MQRHDRRQIGLILLVFVLSACSSPAYANVPPTLAPATHTPAPTVTASLTLAPTDTAPLAPAKTPAPVCAERKGLVVADSFDSETLNYPVELQIYLPPCYADNVGRRWKSYPVLYLLHGLEMTEKTWDEIGVGEAADALINSGGIPPLLIVMPRDRRDSRFGEALVNDVLPYIDLRYRTLADRDHRALGGMSRGAGWALHAGLQHPDLFGALGLHSLAIFYSDEGEVSRWLNKIPPDLVPRFYMDIGDNDSLMVSTDWLDGALTRRDIIHDYHLNPGSHTRDYWAAHLPDYLRWYTANW